VLVAVGCANQPAVCYGKNAMWLGSKALTV